MNDYDDKALEAMAIEERNAWLDQRDRELAEEAAAWRRHEERWAS